MGVGPGAAMQGTGDDDLLRRIDPLRVILKVTAIFVARHLRDGRPEGFHHLERNASIEDGVTTVRDMLYPVPDGIIHVDPAHIVVVIRIEAVEGDVHDEVEVTHSA